MSVFVGRANFSENRGFSRFNHEIEAGKGNQGANAHHEHKRWVPCSKDIKKREDPLWIDHVRNGQAQPKKQSGNKWNQHRHRPTIATVAMATTMNIAVAVAERAERLAIPHKP